jgi:hypothetical protein
MLSIQASIARVAPAEARKMSSGSGMLSTTVQASGVRPGACSISALRSATAARGHGTPGGYWCSAVTISRAPAWRTWSSVTGSSGPYQRHACRICLPDSLLRCTF